MKSNRKLNVDVQMIDLHLLFLCVNTAFDLEVLSSTFDSPFVDYVLAIYLLMAILKYDQMIVHHNRSIVVDHVYLLCQENAE